MSEEMKREIMERQQKTLSKMVQLTHLLRQFEAMKSLGNTRFEDMADLYRRIEELSSELDSLKGG